MSNADWKKLGAIAAIGAGVVTLHGITTKRWENWHTVFVVIGAIAMIGPQIDEIW